MIGKDFQSRLDALDDVIKQAGLIVKKSLTASETRTMVKGTNDFVTTTDREVETFIRTRISERFPQDGVLGEEYGTQEGSDGYVWVIDPVDGTVNFMNSFPLHCISIALQKDGLLVAGAVLNPVYDELFSAAEGQGAYLNGKRIRCTSLPLEQSVALVVPPHRRHESLERFWQNERRIYEIVSDTRSIGSAAMSICYVASGRASMYYEWYLHYYDYAAALLIAKEAGCRYRLKTEGDVTNVFVFSGIYDSSLMENVEL